jgi:phosphoglycolate phosphatase-like HAD superfamily hydrolase
MIGDWVTDTEAAQAAGCASILVMDGRSGDKTRNGADHTVKDISEAVELILSRNGNLRNHS